jgi:crossover junction endodeoxyribonuclease RuvC
LNFQFSARRRGNAAAFFLLQACRRWQIFPVGISPRQFEQMKERLGSRPARRGLTPIVQVPLSDHSTARGASRVILGVDPSLRGTGFGVIRAGRAGATALAQGTIACPRDWERSRCLAAILQALRAVLREHSPDVCVMEGLFFAQNLKTAIIMGEARGAALAAVAEAGVGIFEIAPRKVKQAIVGHGGAQKIAVARMVQRMLNLAALPAPDAADALALALAHAHETSRHQLTPLKRI